MISLDLEKLKILTCKHLQCFVLETSSFTMHKSTDPYHIIKMKFYVPYCSSILNPKETVINLSKVRGLSLFDFRAIARFIRSNPINVKRICFGLHCGLGPYLDDVLEALSENTHITSLDLSKCELTLRNFDQIGRFLETNETLECICLGSNLDCSQYMDQERANETELLTDFFEGIKTNCTLKTLSMDHIKMDSWFPVDRLIKAIGKNEDLVTLNLHGTAFSENKLTDLFKAIDATTISKLNLSYNRFRSQGIKLVTDWLGSTARITSLNLSECDESVVEDVGRNIAEALRTNTSLRKLWLVGNTIGDEGAIMIADALKHNPGLVKLFLGKNGIQTEGAANLLQCSLEKIDLGSNIITEITWINPSVRKLTYKDWSLTKFVINPDSGLEDCSIAVTKIMELVIPPDCPLVRLEASFTKIKAFVIPPRSKLQHLGLLYCKLDTFECEEDCELVSLEISGLMTRLPINHMPKLTKLKIRRMANLDLKSLFHGLKHTQLSELEISGLGPNDETASYIAEYIMSPACNLKSFEIDWEGMTKAGAKIMRQALACSSLLHGSYTRNDSDSDDDAY